MWRDPVNSIVFHIEPTTTEGLHYAHVSYWFCRLGEQQKTYSLLAVLPSSLLVSSVCSKEPWLPSRHLCSLSPARLVVGKHIRLTLLRKDVLFNFNRLSTLKASFLRTCRGCITSTTFLPFDSHKIFVAWLRLLTHPLLLWGSFVYQVVQNNAVTVKCNPQLSLEIVINRSF